MYNTKHGNIKIYNNVKSTKRNIGKQKSMTLMFCVLCIIQNIINIKHS